MNEHLIKTTVEYLEHCKEVFLTDFDWDHLIERTEVQDDLNGITEKGNNDYVNHLFSQLSKEEKSEVQKRVNFDIDFDGASATYYRD